MSVEKNQHIQKLIISFSESIIKALKQMDELQVKLLIVYGDGKFKGVLSIGDIQRAIINNIPFTEQIGNILRENFVVGNDNETVEHIKEKMMKFRIESMPIVNSSGDLIDVIFWDEVFNNDEKMNRDLLDIPVVIMAGGKGVRLKPITNVIPKPLIPLGEKTIIENIIDRLRAIGTKQFYVTVNYKHEMIEFYFRGVLKKNYNISFHLEEKPLGTAGSIRLLKKNITSTFFISNCDIIIDQDYRDIYEYHIKNKNEITIVAALKNYKIPYGILESGEDGILTDIKEKPEYTFMISSGMYILEPEIINEIPENMFYDITDLIDKVKNRGGRVGVFPVSEKSWFDIGEWDEYRNTIREYEKRFTKANNTDFIKSNTRE